MSKDRHLKIDRTLSLFCEALAGQEEPKGGGTTAQPVLTAEQKHYNKQVIKRFMGDIPFSDAEIATQQLISREVLVEILKEREQPTHYYELSTFASDVTIKHYLSAVPWGMDWFDKVKANIELMTSVVPNPYYTTTSGYRPYEFYYSLLEFAISYIRFFRELSDWGLKDFGDDKAVDKVQMERDTDRDMMDMFRREYGAVEEGAHQASVNKMYKVLMMESDCILSKYLKALVWRHPSWALGGVHIKETDIMYGEGSPNNASMVSSMTPAILGAEHTFAYRGVKSGLYDPVEEPTTRPPLYLSMAPNDTLPPYATYTLEQVQELKDKSGYFGLDITVRFDFYTNVANGVSDESWLGFMQGVDLVKRKASDGDGGIVITECDLIDVGMDKVDSVTYNKSYLYHYQVQWFDKMISNN